MSTKHLGNVFPPASNRPRVDQITCRLCRKVHQTAITAGVSLSGPVRSALIRPGLNVSASAWWRPTERAPRAAAKNGAPPTRHPFLSRRAGLRRSAARHTDPSRPSHASVTTRHGVRPGRRSRHAAATASRRGGVTGDGVTERPTPLLGLGTGRWSNGLIV